MGNGSDWTLDANASAGVNVSESDAAGSAVESLVNVVVAVVLALLILATAIGNVFVIAVILLERHLQSVANYLILSLAVADLLVACLVMPLGAVYQVTGKWLLGPELCDMWTSSDVLCCTASILHLVAIATDRYWAVTSIDYIQQRTLGRISLMIGAVWLASLLVSCFPLFGWKDADWHRRVDVFQQCLISQDVGYQVFATLSTFYVPLAIILFLYWRIFLAAKKRIRRRKQPANASGSSAARASSMRGAISSAAPTATTTSSTGISLVSNETALASPPRIDEEPNSVIADPPSSDNGKIKKNLTKRITSVAAAVASKRRNVESKRERKAAKTLAIITGAFVFCWLPFFVIALLMPVCQPPNCHYNDDVVAFFLWLGYFNSTLNPILYTIFSPEFRNAFQKLLRLNGASRNGTSTARSSRAITANNNSKFNELEHQSIAAVSNNYSI